MSQTDLVVSIGVVDSDIAELEDQTNDVDENNGGVRLNDTVSRPERTTGGEERERKRERESSLTAEEVIFERLT